MAPFDAIIRNPTNDKFVISNHACDRNHEKEIENSAM